MVTDVLQAVFGGATLLVAIVASAIGLIQFRDFRRTVREQSRPYVLVDFTTRQTLIMLAVSNSGSRPASNITIEFSPPIASTVEGWAETIAAATSEANPIPVLAPGRAIDWFFDNGLFAVGSDKVPQDYQVEVSYEDLVPRKVWTRSGLRWRRGRERYVEIGHRLSLRPLNETALAQPGLPEIAKSIASIAQQMPKVASSRLR